MIRQPPTRPSVVGLAQDDHFAEATPLRADVRQASVDLGRHPPLAQRCLQSPLTLIQTRASPDHPCHIPSRKGACMSFTWRYLVPRRRLPPHRQPRSQFQRRRSSSCSRTGRPRPCTHTAGPDHLNSRLPRARPPIRPHHARTRLNRRSRTNRSHKPPFPRTGKGFGRRCGSDVPGRRLPQRARKPGPVAVKAPWRDRGARPQDHPGVLVRPSRGRHRHAGPGPHSRGFERRCRVRAERGTTDGAVGGSRGEPPADRAAARSGRAADGRTRGLPPVPFPVSLLGSTGNCATRFGGLRVPTTSPSAPLPGMPWPAGRRRLER